MKGLKGALIFAQSGGPTSVINSSAAGVFIEGLKSESITAVYGAAHGIKGILNERGQTTMSEIVKQYPLEKGLPELFAYFGVLNHFPHKSINTEKHQFIVFDYEHNKRILIPEIIISR